MSITNYPNKEVANTFQPTFQHDLFAKKDNDDLPKNTLPKKEVNLNLSILVQILE